MARRIPTAEEQAERLIRNATNNAQDWLKNTLDPSKDPIDEAKKAEAKYATNTQKAIQEKRFSKGLDRVDRDAMRETIEKVGASGFAAGIANRASKILESRRVLVPLQEAAVAELDKMPNASDADAKSKMLRNFDLQKVIGDRYRGAK